MGNFLPMGILPIPANAVFFGISDPPFFISFLKDSTKLISACVPQYEDRNIWIELDHLTL